MITRTSLRLLIAGTAMAAGLSSCTALVLEDRSECPAYLFFDIANADRFDPADYIHVAAFVYPEGDLLGSDTTTVRAVREKEFCLPVRRSDSVRGYGVTGFGGCRLESGTDWVVPEGSDYGPLWRFEFHTGAMGERFTVPVEMVKDHCVVTVFFEDFDMFPGTGGHFPFGVSVTGNTCGINALTGMPVEGLYRFAPPEMPGGTFRFTVPRQFDRALTLHVENREEYFGNTDPVAEFSIWDWVHAAGEFSWTDRNLPDIRVTIRLAAAELIITVEPWKGDEGGYIYDL